MNEKKNNSSLLIFKFMCPRIVYLILFFYLFQSYQLSKNIAYNIPDPDCTGVFNLCVDADKERLGREAIKAIHEQMDDDKDGMIEPSESSDFIKEELESNTDSIRHRQFQDANLQITFKDLWTQWEKSAVYNWSTDDVVHWVVNYVHLPIYVENFRRNQIDGRMIPRIAANQKHYLSAIMQIRDPRHKRLLVIKATDVVLFGPPPQHKHNLIKDMILISALLISVGACLYAFARHRKTQESMKLMLKDLETLQKAEGNLKAITGKIKAMENELKDKTKVDRNMLKTWFIEVQRKKEEAEKYRQRRDSTNDRDSQLQLAIKEIEQLRTALRQAEEHAQHQSYEAPSELIDLLKRTYHVEEIAFEVKRKSAESAMLTAKEQMSKISKMQKGFFGAVRIAHTGCMDNISELINAAKQRLTNIQDEYEEREKRWNRIASLLDREDLISYSSSSSTSISGNQYLTGTPPISSNNGTTTSLTPVSRFLDSNNRIKRISADVNSLTNTNNDSSVFSKTNNNINIRGVGVNSYNPTQNAQQDTQSETDSCFEYSNSPSARLRRRPNASNALPRERSSTERLVNSSRIVYSHSANGLNNLSTSSTEITGRNISESLDIPLSTGQTKTIASTIPDFHLDTDDSLCDDLQQHYDRKSQISDLISDDQQSVTSSEKARKSILSTRLLKPFLHKRLNKKSNET
ncbi:unnamed protein product [Rotaria sordida]|uniref:SAM domain-containing protein n=1 Tax=Rotaria sordida TaxID=392033 RepID=A0A813NRT9_9BILA|nr:unnamed protein product [Rotaria sordida]